ncbi:NUMOD4 domain-containing protein [Chryseobacterium sp. Ch-15]|uniref:NUMOD4 domain-containing protein n=1 Tax=Chryseobacterium muglaense TaxID=2893752 RepID=A0A9Q3UYT3_9FLAO|nr:NUMOD4 domain-containing protein [Chryseobacterium muglaense]MBD3906395.1 hypothetical protein [Chryseobacterium muglaense]MCC9037082.1 hypothetical protein [Chryseobacterium muglaense]MCM2556627.1 NUMOD4 domain-containing protein [Chryseobacterium muglaense]
MKVPAEFEDEYVKDVLYNTSLRDLQDEEWKLIEGFENYAISNYGRIKSRERFVPLPTGQDWKLSERIMKLIFVKQVNAYLTSCSYNVHCTLSLDGKKYRKSVARLVYHHFVEKFDMNDRLIVIISNDDNGLHVNFGNLLKISVREKRLKTFYNNRARNRNVIYQQPVKQYTVDGKLMASFDSIYEAADQIRQSAESIMNVIQREFLTAGGFRWFLQTYTPDKTDFAVSSQPDTIPDILNTSLWQKLGRPNIDIENPPACMNMSLQDLPEEEWKSVPGYDNRFLISSKGRIKRTSGWTASGRKIFLKEQILAQYIDTKGPYQSLFTILNYKGKKRFITISKFLFYCFVKEFDMSGKTLCVVNNNDPFWKLNLSKLSLHSIHSVLKKIN